MTSFLVKGARRQIQEWMCWEGTRRSSVRAWAKEHGILRDGIIFIIKTININNNKGNAISTYGASENGIGGFRGAVIRGKRRRFRGREVRRARRGVSIRRNGSEHVTEVRNTRTRLRNVSALTRISAGGVGRESELAENALGKSDSLAVTS